MKTEKKEPGLAGRVDALQIALVTLLKMRAVPGFEEALKANAEGWRSGLIATQIPEPYLDEFDSQIAGVMNLMK